MKTATIVLLVSTAVFFAFQLLLFALVYRKMGDVARQVKNRRSGASDDTNSRPS